MLFAKKIFVIAVVLFSFAGVAFAQQTPAQAMGAESMLAAKKAAAQQMILKDSFGIVVRRPGYWGLPVAITVEPKMGTSEGVFKFGAASTYCYANGPFRAKVSINESNGNLVVNAKHTRNGCGSSELEIDPISGKGTFFIIDERGQKGADPEMEVYLQ